MDSPLGPLALYQEGEALAALSFGPLPSDILPLSSPLLEEAAAQVTAYFAGQLRAFSLPLTPKGTAFHRRVWDALCAIPWGETVTYGALAKTVSSNARPVGTACGRNPLPILIPCHRVVAGNGKLGGYSGAGGLETKRRLLTLEQAAFRLV